MNFRKLFPILFLLLFSFSCKKDSNGGPWLIPEDEIFDGGPGKDGIPSVDNPNFADVSDIDYMNDLDLIVGVKIGDEIRGYTHPVLDWHEIVNDEFNNYSLALTYCPLTGTATAWDREINGQLTEFGVSGLLYNTNLIPYDRKTNSNWSQIQLKCVNGSLSGTEINTFQVIETTWETWKKIFPDSKVLTTNTGINRPYGTYPYFSQSGADYRASNSFIIFPVNPLDSRLPAKERVLGVVVEECAKAYPFSHFGQEPVKVIQDTLGGKSIIVVGSLSQNWITAFDREVGGNLLDFSPIENENSMILSDNEGNKWNIWGEAVEGPRLGESLTPLTAFIGYWFAWGAFHPGIEIYE